MTPSRSSKESPTGGDDPLIGGAGNDTLVGDAFSVSGFGGGHDTFVFDTSSNFGNDTIIDAGDELDTISFTGPGLATVADLEARSTVEGNWFRRIRPSVRRCNEDQPGWLDHH